MANHDQSKELNTGKNLLHYRYYYESILFNCVRDGDLKRLGNIHKLVKENDVFDEKTTIKDLQFAKYYAVAFVTLISRKAIEGGMYENTVYKKADIFIELIDQQTSAREIIQLISEALYDWTKTVQEYNENTHVSPITNTCIEIIQRNLFNKVTIKALAQLLNVNEEQLSMQFKKEVGISINKYVRDLKLNLAKDLLINTDMPIAEISSSLIFSTQSYFTVIFKKKFGSTPDSLRKQ